MGRALLTIRIVHGEVDPENTVATGGGRGPEPPRFSKGRGLKPLLLPLQRRGSRLGENADSGRLGRGDMKSSITWAVRRGPCTVGSLGWLQTSGRHWGDRVRSAVVQPPRRGPEVVAFCHGARRGLPALLPSMDQLPNKTWRNAGSQGRTGPFLFPSGNMTWSNLIRDYFPDVPRSCHTACESSINRLSLPKP